MQTRALPIELRARRARHLRTLLWVVEEADSVLRSTTQTRCNKLSSLALNSGGSNPATRFDLLKDDASQPTAASRRGRGSVLPAFFFLLTQLSPASQQPLSSSRDFSSSKLTEMLMFLSAAYSFTHEPKQELSVVDVLPSSPKSTIPNFSPLFSFTAT